MNRLLLALALVLPAAALRAENWSNWRGPAHNGSSPEKGLPATLTLLRDNGYRDDEVVAWLFEIDESLPGSPVVALRENRGREVHRRAQVAGF